VTIVLRSLDMWRCAIARKPAEALCQADLTAKNLVWLPPTRRFAFRADPFGLWEEGKLHIFVEAFDYRSLKGSIELLIYDETFNLLGREMVLSKNWHLSYPFVFRAEDEIWMLPEAGRAGEITLYRAKPFPSHWVPAGTIPISGALDATPLFHDGRWWLFYATAPRAKGSAGELHLAFADRLSGPWRLHPLNPVRRGLESTRPAGTPLVHRSGQIDLPVQDCSRTYGGGIRRLTIHRLDEDRFEAEDSRWLGPSPGLQPYIDGLHTLSAAGDVALIDCKFVDRSFVANLVRQRGVLARRRRASSASA
jgi:hypothetical protein